MKNVEVAIVIVRCLYFGRLQVKGGTDGYIVFICLGEEIKQRVGEVWSQKSRGCIQRVAWSEAQEV